MTHEECANKNDPFNPYERSGVMVKWFNRMTLIIVLAGCQTKERKTATDGLPAVVGGIPIEYLVGEKEGVPALDVKLHEIVISNGQVTVTGEFSGFPGKRLTLDPFFFTGALAYTILFSPENRKTFRLVADVEFITCRDPLPADRIFESSSLYAGGDRPVRFSHSYPYLIVNRP